MVKWSLTVIGGLVVLASTLMLAGVIWCVTLPGALLLVRVTRRAPARQPRRLAGAPRLLPILAALILLSSACVGGNANPGDTASAPPGQAQAPTRQSGHASATATPSTSIIPLPGSQTMPAPAPALALVEVTRVVDGDTIEVRLDGRLAKVRIIGVDTPETVDPERPVMCFGPEASARTTELIERSGWQVELEKDVSETDRYGRLLRYVWLRQPDGRRMLNDELVAEGYAQVSTFPPDVKYQDVFLASEREARARGLGLWGACSGFGVPLTPPATATSAAPDAPTSLRFISVRGGQPGGTAAVIVQTTPGATCSIGYTTPAGTASRARGLIQKTADGAGNASWTWNIGTSTRPGTGSVTVTCGGEQATSPITIG